MHVRAARHTGKGLCNAYAKLDGLLPRWCHMLLLFSTSTAVTLIRSSSLFSADLNLNDDANFGGNGNKVQLQPTLTLSIAVT